MITQEVGIQPEMHLKREHSLFLLDFFFQPLTFKRMV